MVRSRRLIWGGLFFALMFVFAGTNAYQNYFLLEGDPGWGAEQRGGRVLIAGVKPEGPATALRKGDEIVALNGRPLRHALQSFAALRIEPGRPYSMVVRRGEQELELTLYTQPISLISLTIFRLLYLIIPTIFLLAGLTVFLLKPEDKQALLLAVMFGMFIPEGQYILLEELPGLLAGAMVLATVISNFLSPVFFHFFQIFPERSQLLRRFPRLEWYLYLPHLLIFSPYFAAHYLLLTVAPERVFAFREQFGWLNAAGAILFSLYLAGGLLSLVLNYRQASRASQRKMRVVVAGSVVGFAPSFLMTAAYFLIGFENIKPVVLQGIVLVSVFAFTLFPLSFAYAIVRHQVIPIRLILRRGVRYVFVAQGSVVLELIAVFLALGLLLGTVFTYLQASGLVVGVVSGLVSIAVWTFTSLLHRRVIAPMIDRRFFRRAYNAQQVLSDLGQELRHLADLRELTARVSTKVQDALQTEDVTVFLRDEASGDYRCAAFSRPVEGDRISVTAQPEPVIPAGAFVVERLREAAQPLTVDFQDPKSWAHALASADASNNRTRQRECETLQRIRSELLLPVATKDELLGIVSLGPRLGDLPFSREDKDLLMAVVWQMALAIENAQLIRRKADEERLRRELEFAAQVQQRLFPQGAPALATLELAGVCHPASGVGGDYYDFLVLGNGQVGIAVADVAGKGVSAALLMSTVQASLRSQALSVGGQLTELVATMNRLLCRSTDMGSYATFFYAQYEEQTRRLTYVNAGHNPPLLLRAGAAWRAEDGARAVAVNGDGIAAATGLEVGANGFLVKLLETGGPVIGMFESCDYEHEILEVCSGDILIAYTDGVTEALDPRGEEFGIVNLQSVAALSAHLSADELKERIVARVREWCRETPQSDDMTLVVMKVK
jgi:sigma-B regulation protein RsbU (phosphoserine phosphatase)